MQQVLSRKTSIEIALSVAIVTKDSRDALLKTLQSLDVSEYNIEYVFIDGGSTDGCLELIRKKLHQLHNYYFSSSADNGIYDAMNKAINAASGKWIYFLNAGDTLNIKLQAILHQLDNPGFDIALFSIAKDSKVLLSPPSKINSLFFMKSTICHQSAVVNRAVFQSVGYFDSNYSLIADQVFFLNAFRYGFRYKSIDLAICNWPSDGACLKNLKVLVNERRMFLRYHFGLADKVAFIGYRIYKKLVALYNNIL